MWTCEFGTSLFSFSTPLGAAQQTETPTHHITTINPRPKPKPWPSGPHKQQHTELKPSPRVNDCARCTSEAIKTTTQAGGVVTQACTTNDEQRHEKLVTRKETKAPSDGSRDVPRFAQSTWHKFPEEPSPSWAPFQLLSVQSVSSAAVMGSSPLGQCSVCTTNGLHDMGGGGGGAGTASATHTTSATTHSMNNQRQTTWVPVSRRSTSQPSRTNRTRSQRFCLRPMLRWSECVTHAQAQVQRGGESSAHTGRTAQNN